MDGKEYLNQISAMNRPETKTKKSKLLSSKFFVVGLIGVIGLIVIIIFGAILGGNKGGEKNLSIKLLLHVNNTASVIQEYQPLVKSSGLRSSSASLYSVLSNTSRDVTNYLTNKYNYKEKEVSKDVVESASLAKDGLDADLFEAKINGVLDRIYAHKMAYEISLIMTEEAKIINVAGNTSLKESLTASYNSLNNLYDNFNDFSETN